MHACRRAQKIGGGGGRWGPTPWDGGMADALEIQ